ncbi:MAG: hypothetical protein QM778_23335 [Myxococcales bacterium]
MRSRLAPLVLGLAMACKPEPVEPEFPANHCVVNADCWAGTECVSELGVCAIMGLERPYSVVLQVSPQATGGAGGVTFPAVRLDEIRRNAFDLPMPPFVEVQGLLSCQGVPMIAEVALFARAQAPGYPTASIATRSFGIPPDAKTNLRFRVQPNTTFDVNVQPLGAECPPFRGVLTVGTEPVTFPPADQPPPALQTITLALAEDIPESATTPNASTAQGNGVQRVRMSSKRTGSVVSATVNANPKSFTLNVLDSELKEGALKDAYVQVDLNPQHPWSEVIEVPLAAPDGPQGKLQVQSKLRVPVLPKRVLLVGQMKLADNTPVPNGRLVFTSKFPLSSTGTSGGSKDWCQLRKLGGVASSVSCSAQRSVNTDELGNFQVELLPGDYENPAATELRGRRIPRHRRRHQHREAGR